MVGAWYTHADYPNRRIQVGYAHSNYDVPMGLLYRSDGEGGWIPHRWIGLNSYDVKRMQGVK